MRCSRDLASPCITPRSACFTPTQSRSRDSGSAGILEIVEDWRGNAYRAVYTVRFAQAVYVLHCFQKKSKHGIETPAADMNLIRARLKEAEALAKGVEQ